LPASLAAQLSLETKISGKGNAGDCSGYLNEGVGEHVRTRFHFGRKATHEIAEPRMAIRTERRKLVSSTRPNIFRVNPEGRSDR
jgi:hypothetical protein